MAEKRRSQRVTQDITIQLVGFQRGASSAMAQQAQTISVNDHGALLQARSRLEPGAEVMIHNPKNLQNGLFKIVWSKPAPSGSAWNVVVEYEDRDAADFWGIR